MGTWRWRCVILALLGIATHLPRVSSADAEGCNFDVSEREVSTCELQVNVSRFGKVSWRVGSANTEIYLGGPAVDGQNSNTGGYGVAIMNDMVDPREPKNAWIFTKPADPTEPKGRCLTFSYAVNGLGVRVLEVLLLTFSDLANMTEEALTNASLPLQYRTRLKWRHQGTTGGEWRTGQVTFSTLAAHSLVFSVAPNNRFTSHAGFAAVDDIEFTEGPCGDDCMFDVDLCTWTNTDSGDEFNWDLERGSKKRGTGPARDQAFFLDPSVIKGGYAYINSGGSRLPYETARLVSRMQEASTAPKCLRFWVNMNGGGLGHLRVLYQPEGENTTTILWQMWETMSSGTDTWHPCQQTVASSEKYQLMFEGSIRVPGAGDIAIDSITFTEGACPSLPSGLKSSQMDCTFLVDTCAWKVEPSNGTSLSRVPSNTYNPPGHTQSVYKITDMYMSFDLRCFKCPPRSSEALVSPPVTFSTPHCLSFWVLMYTTIASLTHVGALKVVLRYQGKNETVWDLRNPQHAEWVYAQVTIPANASPVIVAIEGVQGPHNMGMIGVDDIAVFPLSCEIEPKTAKVETGDCYFDQNLCGWKLQQTNNNNGFSLDMWHLGRNNRLKDHTFQADTGGYAYMETFKTASSSNLTSPTLTANQTFCLAFWFAPLYTDSQAKLAIYKVEEGEGREEELLWRLNQGEVEGDPDNPTWHYGQLQVNRGNNDYKLVVIGTVTRAGWAIDDLRFISGKEKCRVRPTKAEP